METTKAGQIAELGRMTFVEAPVEALRDGDLLVRTRYASICGSDLHHVNHGVETDPSLWAPGYPGHEGVGEVVESRASGFGPGTRCCSRRPCPKRGASPNGNGCGRARRSGSTAHCRRSTR